jgi:hypothetical protein
MSRIEDKFRVRSSLYLPLVSCNRYDKARQVFTVKNLKTMEESPAGLFPGQGDRVMDSLGLQKKGGLGSSGHSCFAGRCVSISGVGGI